MTSDRAVGQHEVMKEFTWHCIYSKRKPEVTSVDPGLLGDHLHYVRKLHDDGLLYASGPVPGSHTTPPGDGFHVLAVEDIEEARRIAAGDPFHLQDIRTFEVWPWIPHWLDDRRLGLPLRITRLAGLDDEFGRPGRR